MNKLTCVYRTFLWSQNMLIAGEGWCRKKGGMVEKQTKVMYRYLCLCRIGTKRDGFVTVCQPGVTERRGEDLISVSPGNSII